MRQFNANITINRIIAPNLVHLAFEWPDDLEEPKPGQFFTVLPPMVEIGAGTLLRRPLAFAGFEPRFGKADAGRPIAHSIYQIRGAGTKALALQAPGSAISVIGPLGNTFPEPAPDEMAIVAGGGIGIGPMLFLAAAFGARAVPFRLVVGFRNASMIPLRSAAPIDGVSLLWHRLFGRATIATDDGSEGVKGTVLDALARMEPASPTPERWHIYGCGPGPMLAALARFASARRAAAHLSAEQWMACGVGACHGCVLPAAAGGYLRVCADGPIFEARVIDWEASAV